MSNDLVKRLRECRINFSIHSSTAVMDEAADRIEALQKALIEMRNTVYLHPVRIGDSEAEMNAFALTTKTLLDIGKKMKVVLADAKVEPID